jgi:hypothetical protein
MGSTSPISGVAVGGEKQRDMVVLISVRHSKDDLYIRVKAFEVMSPIVGLCLEVNTISARLQRLTLRKQMFAAALCIGNRIVERRPDTVCKYRESDRDFGGGTSERGVEDVCRDTHGYSDSSQR